MTSESRPTVGELLRQEIAKRGTTAYALAREIEYSDAVVSTVSRDINRMSVRFAAALEVAGYPGRELWLHQAEDEFDHEVTFGGGRGRQRRRTQKPDQPKG